MTGGEITFAVMEDDTVVCSECLPEVCDDREPATTATVVHAWIAPGQPCRCCGYDGMFETEAA